MTDFFRELAQQVDYEPGSFADAVLPRAPEYAQPITNVVGQLSAETIRRAMKNRRAYRRELERAAA